MSSVRSRIPVALIGAVLISFVLGSSAINARARLSATLTRQAVADVSETPTPTTPFSHTPRRTSGVPHSSTPTLPREASHTPTLVLSEAEGLPPSPTPTSTRTPRPTITLTPSPWPTPDGGARQREVKVPILMYHHVGPLPEKPDQIRIGLTILSDHFEEQLKFLDQHGYESIDLYQMQYALALGWPLPEKPVVFTFDDAYDDIYQYAFPLMKQYGYTGTVFVPTQWIDEERDGYMSWEQATELYHAGWRLEPHTKTHEEVDGRGRDFQVYQIYGSMETLKYYLGYQPRFFAYPAGRYDDNAIEVLKEVGYWGAVTTDSAQYHRLANAYTWGRVRVSGTENLQDLANRLGEKFP